MARTRMRTLREAVNPADEDVPMVRNPSTASLTPPAHASSTSYEIKVRTGDLAVGRQLNYSIHDLDGVLLLGAGMEITERFKQLLVNRGISEVYVHPEDGATVATKVAPRRVAIAKRAPRRRPARHSDSAGTTINPGLLQVTNVGMPVRNRVVEHGCEAYDAERRREFSLQFHAAAQVIDDVFDQLANAVEPNVSPLRTVASNQLAELAADGDSAVSLTARMCREANLSRRCLQMALLGMSIGIEMDLDFENVRTIGVCGLLHDCGLLQLPTSLRDSAKSMTESEQAEFRRHPIHSVALLERVPGIPPVVPLVCSQVHEQIDGTGYPRGRRAESIHVFARVLHVADAYINLTSRQYNRPPLKPYAAMETLLAQSKERRIDPDVVRSLLYVITLFPVGSYVSLSDGSIAQVLRRNGKHYTQPIVQCVADKAGTRIDPSHENSILDLAANRLHVVRALSTPGHEEVDAIVSTR